MENEYLKIPRIYNKLRDAEKENKTIYISGATGFGKTAAVQYFYRNKPYLRICVEKGSLDQMPEIDMVKQPVVVFDDISWLTDPKSQTYVRKMVETKNKHVIMIGRSGRVPAWIQDLAVRRQFLLADEGDMCFRVSDIQKYMEQRGIVLSKEDLEQIYQKSIGYPVAIMCLAHYLKAGKSYDVTSHENTKIDIYYYFDNAFFNSLEREVQEVLLAIGAFDSFTIEMAEMITGNSRVPYIFAHTMQVGNFLFKMDETTYRFRYMMSEYLRWKRNILYTKEEKEEVLRRAALYYELHDQLTEAMECYEQLEDKGKISKLLVIEAEKHPGIAHLWEWKKYYEALPEEIIRKSPVLISGLSMMYSIALQPEKSESYYKMLQEVEAEAQRGSMLKREAKTRLAYLDIALPHRGVHGMVKILKNVAIMKLNKEIEVPEFSVTGNNAGIMNGGLDFSEWSRNDVQMGILMKKPIEIVLGTYGYGLVNIALAESGFEKVTMPEYEVMSKCNTGYMSADCNGKIEMCYVATGIMARQHIASGQLRVAEEMLDSFQMKAEKEEATQLFSNIETFRMWLQLLKNNTLPAERWLKTAPDEMQEFCTTDRFLYINKVRVYIALGQLEAALGLIERLKLYFTSYKRHYLWIENQILQAICLYRKKDELWETELIQGLKKAQRFHFVRVFAEEGAALKPLLEHLQTNEIDKEFLEQIRGKVNQMAAWYPNYLQEPKVLEEPLTDMEERILRMMCAGATTTEICEKNSFTMNTLKFHNRNIYRKLGVKNRAAAEREAISLGLI